MPKHERYMERAYEALESAKILFENEKYNSAIGLATKCFMLQKHF
jgi:uncharacterized protein (UPF0332 family)